MKKNEEIPKEFQIDINVKLTPELIEDLKANTRPLNKCPARIQDAFCALAFHDKRCLIDEGDEVYRASADLEDILMGKV